MSWLKNVEKTLFSVESLINWKKKEKKINLFPEKFKKKEN